ncbi:MAG: alpha-mannosidase [Armatimonadetes bacterium]|nr:alpha-mannosidase [Armatimonadota bacterium]
MLKHTDLTVRRIHQFIDRELKSRFHPDTEPLAIEFCSVPHATQKDAEAGPWKRVAKGHRYGPAYKVFWFRVTGEVPKRFAGKKIGLKADLGGERTVWKNNAPVQGLDSEHHVMALGQASGSQKPGSSVSFLIQAYSRNPECRVHGAELPRQSLVEEVQGAELVVIDEEVKGLAYDMAFCRNLLEALDDREPAFHAILRAQNAVCNLFDAANPDSVRRCRKILSNALGSLTGEHRHTVIPVGHAHLDTAWLWPLEITHLKMAHTAANQLALIEQYPGYVFVHSQASQYEWLEKEYPALLTRVKAAMKKGQWEPVGSMWVEADCNLSGGEALIRQFLYGRRYFREKLGYETEDMWLPDVFGYSAALPQILAKFNIKYFLTQKISWNQINKFPHNTFYWQGIDGTKIWSHFPPADTYCGNCTPKEILESVRKHRDHARSDYSLYVFGFGDGGGGPTEEHLEFIQRARLSPALPDVQFGRKALDFFREAKARSRDLPTWAGELYFELHRGTYTSQAATKKGNRVSEFLLRDAELLACFANGFPKNYPAADLEAAWKLTLLNQFHDILPGSSVNEVYKDAARDYAIVADIAGRQIESSLQAIGGEMNTEAMACPVALFQNSTVPAQAAVPWTKDWTPASLSTEDEVLPVQLVEEFGERKLVFATPSAALGSVAVGDLSEAPLGQKARLKAAARKIENAEWAVRFDGNGNVLGIQSLEDGSEFVAPGKTANVFQLFEDQPLFWSAWDVDPFAFETGKDLLKSESFEIVERGPVRVAAEVVKKFGKSTIRQRISLGPTPGIRFDTEVDWHEENKMLKVAFPVNVHALKATYEIQLGNVERPTHYNTSWDVARFEVPAQKWVDLSEGDQGVALLNDCKYGHDVHGNVMRMTLLRSPKAPDPECDMGRHRFTYVLYPHFGPYNYGGVVQAAYALNAPVRHAFLKSKKGLDGALPPFVSVEDRNLVVESVKRSEDGKAMIVRLYECHNARGTAELACARLPKEAWLCDLEENPLEELEIVDGLVNFEYKPFEILTIRLTS